jgi:hypothetical protein
MNRWGMAFNFAAGTALVIGAVWSIAGWPLDNIYLFLVGGALVGFVIGKIVSIRQQDHGHKVAELSGKMGLAYAAQIRRDDVKPMRVLEDWSSGNDCMSGDRDGVRVQVLDLTAVRHDKGDHTTTRKTVALLPVEGMPDFSLRPRTWSVRILEMTGVKGITFDSESVQNPSDRETIRRFSKRFQLLATDVIDCDDLSQSAEKENAIRRLFTLQVMRVFNQHTPYSLQAHNGQLAIWRGRGIQAAQWRPELLTAAMSIRAALNGAATTETTATPIPRISGTELQRQARRFRNRAFGGIIGLILGIILTFSVDFAGRSARFFSGDAGDASGSSALHTLMFFVGFQGGALLGAVVGILLASMVPIRVDCVDSSEIRTGKI